MRALDHDPADAALVDDMIRLGCLPPAYTRERRPGLFDCWEARAFLVRDLARDARDIREARAECDRYSGQPLPIRAVPAPFRPRLDEPPPVQDIPSDPLAELARELNALIGEAA